MAARGHFVFPIDDKNHRVLVIWNLNGYDEYEFDRCIADKAMACTSVSVRRRRRRRRDVLTAGHYYMVIYILFSLLFFVLPKP